MKVFFLEEVYCEGIDSNDNERVEIRLPDGFWADKAKLELAKERIKVSLGDGWKLEVTVYDLKMKRNQKYIYVLNYEYSLVDKTCFYYRFEPQTSRKKCNSMKKVLLLEDKYKDEKWKIYSGRNKGWFIELFEIVY